MSSAEVQDVQIQALTTAINKLSDKVDMLVQKLEQDYATKEHVREKIELHQTEDELKFERIENDLRLLSKVVWGVVGATGTIAISLIIALLNSFVQFIHIG